MKRYVELRWRSSGSLSQQTFASLPLPEESRLYIPHLGYQPEENWCTGSRKHTTVFIPTALVCCPPWRHFWNGKVTYPGDVLTLRQWAPSVFESRVVEPVCFAARATELQPRGESLKRGGWRDLATHLHVMLEKSLAPIRFAVEEQHISPLLNKPWWERRQTGATESGTGRDGWRERWRLGEREELKEEGREQMRKERGKRVRGMEE